MRRSRFVPLACLLANAAALHTLFLLFIDMDAPAADQTGLLIWWGCLAGAWLGLDLFLRRERSLRSVLVLLAAALGLQLVLTLLTPWRCGVVGWAALLAGWGFCYYRCWSFLTAPVPPEQLMLTFETTAFTLFLAAFFVTNSLMAPGVLIHLALATLLALAALARQRSAAPRAAARSNGGGKALLGVILAAVGGVAALCAACFTQGLSVAVAWAEGAIRTVGTTLFRAFEAFMTFLASLLPDDPYGDLEFVEEGGGISMEGGVGEEQFLDLNWLLYALLGLAALVVLVLFLHALRKGGFGRQRVMLPSNRPVRRKGSGAQALWRRFTARIRAKLRYLRLRNTPMGLLVWLERRFDRRAEESPRAFLRRCANACPHCAGELAALADWLDGYYFAPDRPENELPIAQMRHRLKMKDH